MSSIYAIFATEQTIDENGEIVGQYDEEEMIIIGYTRGFSREGFVLKNLLPRDTKVYCIDNGTRVRTLQDLIEYYNTM